MLSPAYNKVKYRKQFKLYTVHWKPKFTTRGLQRFTTNTHQTSSWIRDHMDHCNNWIKVWGHFSYNKQLIYTYHIEPMVFPKSISFRDFRVLSPVNIQKNPFLQSHKLVTLVLENGILFRFPGCQMDEYPFRKAWNGNLKRWKPLCPTKKCWDLANPALPKSVVSKTLFSLYSSIDMSIPILLMEEIRLTSWYGESTVIYRVLSISGG